MYISSNLRSIQWTPPSRELDVIVLQVGCNSEPTLALVCFVVHSAVFFASPEVLAVFAACWATDILDIKPKSMGELTEVITAATFHVSDCSVFLYSSSRGYIRMGDMRTSALCDQHAKGMQGAQRLAYVRPINV